MGKMVDVLSILETVNRRNKQSTCPADVRKGWNSILEEILFRKNIYCGYAYLGESEVPKGELPGIKVVEGVNTFPDETRRYYYPHSKLVGGTMKKIHEWEQSNK